MTNSFVELIESTPDDVAMTVAERNELLVLARSADREATKAEAGDEAHELGTTMAKFLLRFTELVGAGSPETVEIIRAELADVIDAADERAIEEFRRGL
jgi:type II secretory pathway predicted ATPase ExeA